MSCRTLMIGFDKRIFDELNDDNIRPFYNLEDAPTLYDYEMIFLSSGGLNYPILAECKKNEFKIFFNNDGILILYTNAHIPSGILPFELPNMKYSKGEVIIPNIKHPLSSMLKKYTCCWDWHCDKSLSDDLIIGRNSPGFEVGFEVKLENGKVFVLPNIKDSGELGSYIMDTKELIETTYILNPLIAKPSWIDNYQFDKEILLKSKSEEIAKDIKRMQSFKEILFLTGNLLSKRVSKLLKNMEFDVEWKEHIGQHDIEMIINGRKCIIEVKGLKGCAKNDDVRQLLDHYYDRLEEQKGESEPKGIFIVNHFREIMPSERPSPYTEDAIKIAKREDFCLLTTSDLLNIYNDFLNKRMNRESLGTKILNTKGLLQI
jgi:hypothetical protein